MVCFLTCGLSISFFTASAIMMLTPKTVNDKLENILDKEQLEIYRKITKERLMLYIQGLVLGLIFALLFMAVSQKVDNIYKCCGTGFIIAIVAILYYHLMPKSDWMVLHLKTQEQNKAWLDMYRYMKNRWHASFLVSMAGFTLATYALSK
jgi:uncharacterized protein YacL